jgi:methionyl-tRNA formyltransferase
MGTPDFACPSLMTLLARPDPVVGVVCQPDKPKGRGLHVDPPPVKRLALAHGVPVLQPATLRTSEALAAVAALQPDLIVVAAYGKILPRTWLDLPPHGCVNVHASLLPRHRGAAPIQHAILAGDATTGVTIMAMNETMDAGDILLVRDTPITDADTGGSLTARLATLGAGALATAIDQLHAGTLPRCAQPTTGITFAPRIEREHARLDWTHSAAALARRVRAFQPGPVTFTTWAGTVLRVHQATAIAWTGSAAPGTVLRVNPTGIVVATGEGALTLLEVQLEGRKRLPVAAFLAGARLAAGTCLGT